MTITAEQLKTRQVGGSMVSTILGLNPYKHPEELRLEILGRLAPDIDGTEAPIVAGNIFESGIREYYAARTGRVVHQVHRTVTNDRYPWLTCHLDGEVKIEKPKRGIEIKNVGYGGAKVWGKAEDGANGVPEWYLPQVLTYQLVTGWPLWDVAAYFGGPDLRVYEIERDDEFEQLIVESTHDFWHTNVLQDVPITIEHDHKTALKAVRRIYPGTNGETLQSVLALHEHYRAVLFHAQEQEKRYKAIAEGAKAFFLTEMGEAAILQFPDGAKFTRKVVKRKPYTVEASEYLDFRYTKAKEAVTHDE